MPGGRKRRSNAFSTTVGIILDDARLEQMLTQRQLAERVGVSTPHVGKYLRGAAAPTVVELYDMCAALGLDVVGVVSDAIRNLRT